MPCEYPPSAPADSQPKINTLPYPETDSKAVSQETPRAADHQPSRPTFEPPKATPKSSKDTSKDESKDAAKECALKGPKISCRKPKAVMPLWQILLVTMGLIMFVFAFAVLIAHCLAWFLVYKTEARLGEVRTGLLRGGEMKLCLCNRS
ncbi:hypothetical protein E8E12_001954 [Didymella heteroderae]|uniref:Uncharacterized protein n=1 Tax=Didymella heteroderae TaxID=1769908 RepID=A0A9P5BXC7_9PLEO|nr:hypothetical protein E8E12_001954 [Didymella heteroderae]